MVSKSFKLTNDTEKSLLRLMFHKMGPPSPINIVHNLVIWIVATLKKKWRTYFH